MEISCRKVWTQLQSIEDVAPFHVLERRVGGRDDGATHLTLAIPERLEQFKMLRRQVTTEANRCFQECFDPGERDEG